MRIALWVISGVVLGLILHIGIILALPAFASQSVWSRIAALGPVNKVLVLRAAGPGIANPLQLDPGLAYGVCRVNLADGPGVVSGILPDTFWSLAIFNKAGEVTYSTTNRDGIGRNLNLGIFNADQTHLLAEQRIDVADGLLIVESDSNDVFVLIRLAPPQLVEHSRYETALSKIVCGNIKVG
jgi:uncharacterized membrane protein